MFISTKVYKDPQSFIDDIQNIFRVMQALKVNGVEFVSYQLKDVAYY